MCVCVRERGGEKRERETDRQSGEEGQNLCEEREKEKCVLERKKRVSR